MQNGFPNVEATNPTTIAISLRLFLYNPNCISAGANGPATIMDGIALKCDLHSSLTFRLRKM